VAVSARSALVHAIDWLRWMFGEIRREHDLQRASRRGSNR
jgi:hypothetical protein